MIVDLISDPGNRGCAAFWPTQTGWHRIMRRGMSSFYVQPATAYPAMRDTDATLKPAMRGARDRLAAKPAKQVGSPWPWFALLIVAVTGVWIFERRNPDRIRIDK